MRRAVELAGLLLLVVMLAGCGTHPNAGEASIVPSATPDVRADAQDAPSSEPSARQGETEETVEEDVPVKIQITVGDTIWTAIPEDNVSAKAFLELLRQQPVTVEMSDYAGMEKVGPLGTDLPRSDAPIHVGAGDVILYQGNQITIYYGTNSWNFTKLAVIEHATRESLLDALGSGDVSVTFSLAE